MDSAGNNKTRTRKHTDPVGLQAATRSATWNKNIRRIKVGPELCGYWISTTAKIPFFHVLVFPIATRIPEFSSSDRSQRRRSELSVARATLVKIKLKLDELRPEPRNYA